MTKPTRTKETEAAYLRRFAQLKSRVEKSLSRKCTVMEFATALVERIRPQLSPQSWRQYRAAACYGLELKRVAFPDSKDPVDTAVLLLRNTPPAGRPPDRTLRTSQKKAKKVPIDDLTAIQRHVLAGQSPRRQNLADYLAAADLTGLRPCEWRRSQLRPSTTPGLQWELIVACAKRTNGRAHGNERTLRYQKLEAELVVTLMRWIAVAREAELNGRYGKLMKALGSLMRNCCAEVFRRRKQRPTLYTPRHQAAARWKAFFVRTDDTPEKQEHGRAIVATLLGHATDVTATHHYARPDSDERGSRGLAIPVADPSEVARIRRKYAVKLEMKAARELLPASGRRT
ncbi:MAG: hypothetical protein RO009_01210 [Pseudorhodoplanes sp.]|jgi:hypothetical protein|nr:hypothetical protein [Pseudorhodoplanes sp.]